MPALPPLDPLRHAGNGLCLSPHCSRGFVTKPRRRVVRRASTARKKGGILETVCRPTEWRARPSQQRICGCSRSLRKQCGLKFLPEMCVGSPVPVGEPTSFKQRREMRTRAARRRGSGSERGSGKARCPHRQGPRGDREAQRVPHRPHRRRGDRQD